MGLVAAYLIRQGIKRKEMVSFRCMRNDACLGVHFGLYVRLLEEFGRRFHKQEIPFGASFKIHARGFEVLIMRTIRFGESVVKKDDERKTGFAQCATYLFLAFRDSGTDKDGTVSGLCKTLVFTGVYLGLCEGS